MQPDQAERAARREYLLERAAQAAGEGTPGPSAGNAPATAISIGGALCAALGVDPTRTTRMVLTVEAGGLVQLDITQFVAQTQGLALAELLTQRFDLVQREYWRSDVKPADSEPGSTLP